jgi:hypothetical protein
VQGIGGRIEGDAVTERAMSFFGVQSPWYTVGWTMASSIERAFGRDRVLSVLCDHRQLLRTYNQAAAYFESKRRQAASVVRCLPGAAPRLSNANLAIFDEVL